MICSAWIHGGYFSHCKPWILAFTASYPPLSQVLQKARGRKTRKEEAKLNRKQQTHKIQTNLLPGATRVIPSIMTLMCRFPYF